MSSMRRGQVLEKSLRLMGSGHVTIRMGEMDGEQMVYLFAKDQDGSTCLTLDCKQVEELVNTLETCWRKIKCAEYAKKCNAKR